MTVVVKVYDEVEDLESATAVLTAYSTAASKVSSMAEKRVDILVDK